MNNSLILTFCLCCNFLIGQESKVIKLDEVSTFKNEVIDIIELNGQILYALNKPIDIYSKVEKGPFEGLDFLNQTYAIEFLNGTQFSFNKNEYLIYYDKDKIITAKNNIDEKLTIIKEYFVNHANVKELKAIDIPYSESPIFYLKSVEKLLISDKMEGGGYSYEIISMNNTKNNITITPFQTGYLESDELIMKDRIIFINQNAGNKEEIKTTIFNLETNEITVEKLTDLGNFQYYKSFLIGKNILLSVYGNKVHDNKLIFFDLNMNNQWSCSTPYVYDSAFFDEKTIYLPSKKIFNLINQSDGDLKKIYNLEEEFNINYIPTYLSFIKNEKKQTLDFFLGRYENQYRRTLENIIMLSIDKNYKLTKYDYNSSKNFNQVFFKKVGEKPYIINGNKISSYEY